MSQVKNIKKFLKQILINVPFDFIDDFYKIANEDILDENQIGINFELVCKWINVRKDNFKRVLILNFEKDYDYNSTFVKIIGKNNGTNKEIIKITPSCFKELCMISQTEKAKEVRKYYLEIEKALKKHYIKIQDILYKQIGILKNNQKPKNYERKGIIYIYETEEKSLLKIGKTLNLKGREASYNGDKANRKEPLAIIEVENVDEVESCMKTTLKKYQYRKRKEIYEVNIEIIKQMCLICEEFMKGMKKLMQTKPKELKKNIKKMENTKLNLIAVFKKNDIL